MKERKEQNYVAAAPLSLFSLSPGDPTYPLFSTLPADHGYGWKKKGVDVSVEQRKKPLRATLKRVRGAVQSPSQSFFVSWFFFSYSLSLPSVPFLTSTTHILPVVAHTHIRVRRVRKKKQEKPILHLVRSPVPFRRVPLSFYCLREHSRQ